MTLSSTRQRNAVSEGFALGLLRNDRVELPRDKVAIDLAFDHAWRNWDRKHLYPQVSTDLRNGSDGIYVITRARKNHGVIHFYWDADSWPYKVVARHGASSIEEVESIAENIDGGLPLSVWAELVRLFLDRAEK